MSELIHVLEVLFGIECFEEVKALFLIAEVVGFLRESGFNLAAVGGEVLEVASIGFMELQLISGIPHSWVMDEGVK